MVTVACNGDIPNHTATYKQMKKDILMRSNRLEVNIPWIASLSHRDLLVVFLVVFAAQS